MKRLVSLALVGVLGGLLFSGSALAVSYEMLDKLDITAVRSMQVRSSGNSYYLDLVVQMRNTNDRDIMLKNCNFSVKLGSDKYSPRFIGNARPSEIEMRSAIAENAPSTDVNLQIGLGSKQGQVLDTLTYVMNIVGNPSNQSIVILDGDANAAVRVKRGWADEPNRVPISGWEWSPRLQKELLME